LPKYQITVYIEGMPARPKSPPAGSTPRPRPGPRSRPGPPWRVVSKILCLFPADLELLRELTGGEPGRESAVVRALIRYAATELDRVSFQMVLADSLSTDQLRRIPLPGLGSARGRPPHEILD